MDVRYVLDDRRLRYRGNKGAVTAQPRPTYMACCPARLREPYEWGRWHDARSIHRPSTGHGHAHVTRPPSAGAAAITQPPHTGGCCPLKRNGRDTDGLRGVRQSAEHRANCRTLAEESTVPRPRDNAMPPPTAPPRERSCKAQEQPAHDTEEHPSQTSEARAISFVGGSAKTKPRPPRSPSRQKPTREPCHRREACRTRPRHSQRRHRATATSATLRRHQPGSPSHPQTAGWPPARAPSSSSATPPSRASRRDKKCVTECGPQVPL